MPEVELDAAGVTAIVCQFETARVSQPVGSSRCYLGPLPQSYHQLVEPVRRKGMASFRHENIAARGLLFGLELPEPAQFSTSNWMVGVGSVLDPATVDQPPLPVDIGPLQPDQFTRSEAVNVAEQNHKRIPKSVPAMLAGRDHELVDFGLG